MAYSLVSPQPGPRAGSLRWEDVGPGLYNDGEALVAIGGDFAAVSVQTEWLENGEGIVLKGCARWCDATGQTILCEEKHVETSFHHKLLALQVNEHSVTALKKDVLLLLLGEPVETVNAQGVPIIDLSDAAKLNVSIRHAIESIGNLNEDNDAGSLLA